MTWKFEIAAFAAGCAIMDPSAAVAQELSLRAWRTAGDVWLDTGALLGLTFREGDFGGAAPVGEAVEPRAPCDFQTPYCKVPTPPRDDAVWNFGFTPQIGQMRTQPSSGVSSNVAGRVEALLAGRGGTLGQEALSDAPFGRESATVGPAGVDLMRASPDLEGSLAAADAAELSALKQRDAQLSLAGVAEHSPKAPAAHAALDLAPRQRPSAVSGSAGRAESHTESHTRVGSAVSNVGADGGHEAPPTLSAERRLARELEQLRPVLNELFARAKKQWAGQQRLGELERVVTRERWSALLPQLSVRAGYNTDQTLRLTPVVGDDDRWQSTGGANSRLELRAVWDLHRLVDGRSKLSIERLHAQLQREWQREEQRLAALLQTWMLARVNARFEDTPLKRVRALASAAAAAAALDRATRGWFSRAYPATNSPSRIRDAAPAIGPARRGSTLRPVGH